MLTAWDIIPVRGLKAAANSGLDDLTIPFANNQAERELRMLKVAQQISWAFRSEYGTAAFARIRGYLSCLSKQGMALYPSFT